MAGGFVSFLDVAWVRWIAAIIGALGLVALVILSRQALAPRVGYKKGKLRLIVGLGWPERVPLDVVEGFLLGQGPSWLPTRKLANAPARTLVVRLAERAHEWERKDVFPPFASWCGHYVTIRGAWCEPLNVALVNQLNQRLHDAKTALAKQGGAA